MKRCLLYLLLGVACSGCFYTNHTSYTAHNRATPVGGGDAVLLELNAERKPVLIPLPIVLDFESGKYALTLICRQCDGWYVAGSVNVTSLQVYRNGIPVYVAREDEPVFKLDSAYIHEFSPVSNVYSTEHFLKLRKRRQAAFTADITFTVTRWNGAVSRFTQSLTFVRKHEHGLGFMFAGVLIPFSKQ